MLQDGEGEEEGFAEGLGWKLRKGSYFFLILLFFFSLFNHHQQVKNILTVTNRLSGAFINVNKYTRGAGSVQTILLSFAPPPTPSSTPSLSSRIGISKSTLPALLVVEAILGGRGVGRRFLESYSINKCYSKMSIAFVYLESQVSLSYFLSFFFGNAVESDATRCCC